jgi:hypothetical protein
MVFKSAATGTPKISFPRAMVSLERDRMKASLVTNSFSDTVSR